MGAVQFEGINFNAVIERPAAGVSVVRLTGWDAGELRGVPLRELQKHVDGGGPLALFIDARNARGASMEVSGEWAEWLARNRAHFSQISMLTGSRYVHVTATFVRRYAGLAGLMRIYTDATAFEEALSEAVEPA